MNHSENDSLWLLAALVALLAMLFIVATSFDEPEVKLEPEVRAEVMLKLCFPEGIYTQSAHKYCQKFKEDLLEHMTMRERNVAEKCLKDNVNINKCVRVK